jgi:TIR domain
VANVFVCYRGPGAVTAIRLASELRDAGHQVWLDEWEIGLGASIIGRMSEGLGDRAAYLLLCISRNGMDAPWISRDWLATLARRLEGHGVRILPVLLERGSSPRVVPGLPCADLASNWAAGLADLQRALR